MRIIRLGEKKEEANLAEGGKNKTVEKREGMTFEVLIHINLI